ncbi:MAG: hypothetical protein ACRCXX_13780 [Cetobacterium sp.]|uniref:hypothetical protein n=1 Tax=Cetobacterium sp. TaxID=2071632 RepID=UPI003F3D04E0
MKKRLFHGTSFRDTISILKEGFKNNERVWQDSEEEYIYFFELDRMKEVEYLESKKEASQACIRRALEAAQITSALKKNYDPIICAVEVIIDEEYVHPDSSGDHLRENLMHDAGAVQVNIKDLIKHGEIVKVFVSEDYHPSISGLYIQGILGRDRCNLITDTWNEREIEFVKNLELNFIEPLLDIEWRTYDNKDFLQKFCR